MTSRWIIIPIGLGACASEADLKPIEVGSLAPSYTAVQLAVESGPGDSLSLTALRGHAVLLNVWATWCAPCREEMPGLQRLHAAFSDSGLRVLGVSIDARGTDDDVRAFAREFGIGFTLLRDPDERVARAFRTIGVPETFLIDARGIIVRRWIGQFDPDAPEVAELIRKTLSTTSSGGSAAVSGVRPPTRLAGGSHFR